MSQHDLGAHSAPAALTEPRKLRAGLGSDPADPTEPAVTHAKRGKLGQRVTVPLTHADDLVLVHPSDDARIRAQFLEHPEDIDRYSGRRHRVALISDASALPAGTDPAVALVGMESAAVFLHHHSGLDIIPLPVNTQRVSLGEIVAALSPGFAAICLHHTSAEHADSVRYRLDHHGPQLPILDTGDDATAVTVLAALINAAGQTGIPVAGGRVLIIGAHTAPAIGALLTAAGARDLTFVDSRLTTDVTSDDDRSAHYDILIDLSTTETSPPDRADAAQAPRIILAMNSAERVPHPAGIIATSKPGPRQLHPLLAMPGLLSAAVYRRIGVDHNDRLAAAHALARLAPAGQLLPDPLDPRITSTIYAATTTAPRPRRPTADL